MCCLGHDQQTPGRQEGAAAPAEQEAQDDEGFPKVVKEVVPGNPKDTYISYAGQPGQYTITAGHTVNKPVFEQGGGCFHTAQLVAQERRAEPDPATLAPIHKKWCRNPHSVHEPNHRCQQQQRGGTPYCSACDLALGWGCERLAGRDHCGKGRETVTAFGTSQCQTCMHDLYGLLVRDHVRERSGAILEDVDAVLLFGRLFIPAGVANPQQWPFLGRFDVRGQGKFGVANSGRILDSDAMTIHTLATIRGAKAKYTDLVQRALPFFPANGAPACVKATRLDSGEVEFQLVGVAPLLPPPVVPPPPPAPLPLLPSPAPMAQDNATGQGQALPAFLDEQAGAAPLLPPLLPPPAPMEPDNNDDGLCQDLADFFERTGAGPLLFPLYSPLLPLASSPPPAALLLEEEYDDAFDHVLKQVEAAMIQNEFLNGRHLGDLEVMVKVEKEEEVEEEKPAPFGELKGVTFDELLGLTFSYLPMAIKKEEDVLPSVPPSHILPSQAPKHGLDDDDEQDMYSVDFRL